MPPKPRKPRKRKKQTRPTMPEERMREQAGRLKRKPGIPSEEAVRSWVDELERRAVERKKREGRTGMGIRSKEKRARDLTPAEVNRLESKIRILLEKTGRLLAANKKSLLAVRFREEAGGILQKINEWRREQGMEPISMEEFEG
jgi:hypothetical protein